MEKKKIFMIILIMILAVLFVFAMHFIRNFLIIEEISRKEEELSKINNFSFSISSEGTREFYYKEGISKEIIKDEDKHMITWFDENSKEQIRYYPEIKKAEISSINTPRVVLPTLGLTKENKMIYALFANISVEEVNEEKCYTVKLGEETEYISKEIGIMLKNKNGKILKDGVEKENIVEYKDIKLNEVKSEEMRKTRFNTDMK